MAVIKDLYTVIVLSADNPDKFISYSNINSFNFTDDDEKQNLFCFRSRLKNINITESFDTNTKFANLDFSYYNTHLVDRSDINAVKIKSTKRKNLFIPIKKNDYIIILGGTYIKQVLSSSISSTDPEGEFSYESKKEKADRYVTFANDMLQNVLFSGYISDVVTNDKNETLTLTSSSTLFFKDIFIPNGVFDLNKDNLETVLSSINVFDGFINFKHLLIKDYKILNSDDSDDIISSYPISTKELEDKDYNIRFGNTYNNYFIQNDISSLELVTVQNDKTTNLNRLLEKYKENGNISIQIITNFTKTTNSISMSPIIRSIRSIRGAASQHTVIETKINNVIIVKQGLTVTESDTNLYSTQYVPEAWIFEKNIEKVSATNDDINYSVRVHAFTRKNSGAKFTLFCSKEGTLSVTKDKFVNSQEISLQYVLPADFATITSKTVKKDDIINKIINSINIKNDIIEKSITALTAKKKRNTINGVIKTKIIQFKKIYTIDGVNYYGINAFKVSDKIIIENEKREIKNSNGDITVVNALFIVNKVEYNFDNDGLFQTVYFEGLGDESNVK